MFKKIVLVGLLVMFLSSVVYAELTISILKTDEDFPVTSNDFWVWLEIPEQLPPPGQTFLVDLYIAAYGGSLGDFTIRLVPSSKNVEFTNKLLDSPYAPYLFSNDVFPKYDANAVTISADVNYVTTLSPGRKYHLRSLEMKVIKPGKFQYSLDEVNSFAAKDQSNNLYDLKQGNTRVVRNTLCVPNPDACLNNCGKVDNGCGKIVSCGNTCLSGQVCSTNNDCVDALNLALPNPSDKELCEAVIKVSIINARDVLKGTSNALRGNNIDDKQLEGCPGEDCKYYILTTINNVLTTWFGKQ